jgi:hypothetical protein
MGITIFKYDKNSDVEYFRVTRAWNGVERQHYVRILDDREGAYEEAKRIDALLEERQKAFFSKRDLPSNKCLRQDGGITGVQRVIRSRPGRKPADIFKLRINVPGQGRPFMTTISVDTHGFDNAFQQVIDKICEWYGIDSWEQVRRDMLARVDFYRRDPVVHNSVTIDPRLRPENIEDDEWTRKLVAEIRKFEDKSAKPGAKGSKQAKGEKAGKGAKAGKDSKKKEKRR